MPKVPYTCFNNNAPSRPGVVSQYESGKIVCSETTVTFMMYAEKDCNGNPIVPPKGVPSFYPRDGCIEMKSSTGAATGIFMHATCPNYTGATSGTTTGTGGGQSTGGSSSGTGGTSGTTTGTGGGQSTGGSSSGTGGTSTGTGGPNTPGGPGPMKCGPNAQVPCTDNGADLSYFHTSDCTGEYCLILNVFDYNF